MKKSRVSMTPRFERPKRRVFRFTRRLFGAIAALSIVAMLPWVEPSTWASRVQPDETQNSTSAWGAEVLEVESVSILDHLIRPANACGLGASSCFRCHNGKRALAPAKQPWHRQHTSVNHSCVGCHAGNPRIIRKEMSHRRLISDPRSKPEASCKGCHQGDNFTTLVQSYTKIAN